MSDPKKLSDPLLIKRHLFRPLIRDKGIEYAYSPIDVSR